MRLASHSVLATPHRLRRFSSTGPCWCGHRHDRDGTYLIEDGHITRPVRDARFTDSVLRILAAVEALGVRQRLVTEGEFYGRRFATGVVCQALRTDGFRVTGATT
jgi:predicted Zn-dependent protease